MTLLSRLFHTGTTLSLKKYMSNNTMTLSDLQGHSCCKQAFSNAMLQFCITWQDFKKFRASRGLSATAEPLIVLDRIELFESIPQINRFDQH